MGIPIIINETGMESSCLKTLAINMPMDDAENAVRLYVTLLGYNFICKGIWLIFVTKVKGI